MTGWPEDAKFNLGDRVQRANTSIAPLKGSISPAYRFPGTVCGWYRTPSGSLGFAVSNEYESACIQIFPQSELEVRV